MENHQIFSHQKSVEKGVVGKCNPSGRMWNVSKNSSFEIELKFFHEKPKDLNSSEFESEFVENGIQNSVSNHAILSA